MSSKESKFQHAMARMRQQKTIEQLNTKDGKMLLCIEEQIGKCLQWPSRFTEAFLSSHLRFPNRWQLTLFLLGNGLDPKLIVEWYEQRKVLKDKSARTQVADLIQKHKNGTLEAQGRTTWVMEATSTKPVWERKHKWDGVGDPIENKVQLIETPHFASDYQHEVYWTEAIERLRSVYD